MTHTVTRIAMLAAALAPLATAQQAEPPAPLDRRVYMVATAHLDTQWRWTIQDTINQYIPDTMRTNLDLLRRYPGYVFSFEGAFRYRLMKEYYPEEYEQVRRAVRAGRWKVAGSWVDAVDTHVPSPESLIRHALYGNGFFRRELGATSRDVFLPDCFGFGYALPSVAAHSGLFAFSTQKLAWGSAIRPPFDVGLWEGIDGAALIAAIDPGDYTTVLRREPALDPTVYAAQDLQALRSGLPVALRYFGTGDVGGGPTEGSVRTLQRSLDRPGATRVVPAAPDQLARDLLAAASPEQIGRLPRYRGEFLMTAHGTGCYTAQAEMKRRNRANEVLADAAERAAVAADWLGSLPYPRETLREAWERFLWHQFHDDLTGTSIPEAYAFSWNDEAIAGNQLADVLATAAAGVARALDTRTDGVPVVVFNPLAIAREDVVDTWVTFPVAAPAAVEVTGPDGRAATAQVVATDGRAARVVFLAGVAPVSFSAFAVRPAAAPAPAGVLSVSERGLENARYRVALDEAGDVASVYDKRLDRELLRAPLRLQLLDDEPQQWSAWELDYGDVTRAPKAMVAGPAKVRVLERGPARVALEVARETLGSRFVQRLFLAGGGAGGHLEIEHEVDWRTPGTLLKAAFPLASANELATYDLGLGVVQRGTNRPNLYEVPAQRWAELGAGDGSFGVAVINDSRYGWDHPDPGTLRLTLVHTPRVVPSWSWLADQASMDLGHHRVRVALAGHAGDWRAAGVPFQADRFNQPLLAWQTAPHAGGLGGVLSFLEVATADGGVPPVAVRALKRAEASGEVIVRLQELSGAAVAGVRLRLAGSVVAARELNGAEEPLTEHGAGGALPDPPPPLALVDGSVVLDLAPFRPRTLAITMAPAPVTAPAAVSTPLDLPYDRDGISAHRGPRDGDFDGGGRTLAGELLPERFVAGGVEFRTGPRGPGEKNVVSCRGQRLALPAGSFDAVYLAAAAIGGDRTVTVLVGGEPVTLTVHDWAEPVAQWNNRLVAGAFVEAPAAIAPSYEKSQPLAWVGTHRHGALGEVEPYVLTHIYRYRVALPPGARSLTLPDDERVVVLGATAVAGELPFPAAPRGDGEELRTLVHVRAPHRVFTTSVPMTLTSPNPGATIHFTLDGSEPTEESPIYERPVELRDTATVKARAFAPGLDASFVAGATFERRALRPPDAPAVGARRAGLDCGVYEGQWRRLPEFSALRPVRTIALATIGLPEDRPEERFGMVCRGYLEATVDGVYTLGLRSDDGSRLFVGSNKVIDNDGTHDKQERRAEVALAAGRHAIRVEYFQWSYGATLELWMGSPARPYTQVSPDLLSR